MSTLVLDISNILYRSFLGNAKGKGVEELSIVDALETGIVYLNYWVQKFKSDTVVIVFDDYSWRKEYTKNSISHKKYKGTRRSNLSKADIAKFVLFDQHVREFYTFLKDASAFVVIRQYMLEADDIIAYCCDNMEGRHTIISADKDFIQLLDNPNTRLINTINERPRTLMEWNYDHEYFMYEKCLRGDAGDNVMSSYPRLRKTKIFDSYGDDYKRANIMAHQFSVEYMDGDELARADYITGEVFKENQILMDLRMQPKFIKKIIKISVENAFANKGCYSYQNFIKFCGKFKLEGILANITTFGKLFSCT